MPNIKDQIGDIVGTLANAEPAQQINKGIAKVGELAEPYVNQAKGAITKGLDWAQKKLAPTPAPTDIELPKDPKKKVARPITRSLGRK